VAAGIDIRVDGKIVKGVSGYTVSEESTPIDPSDTTGATGTLSVSFLQRAKNVLTAKRMYRKQIDIEDRGQGITQGIARVPSTSGGTISIGADQRLALLAVVRTAAPFNGTLGDYLTYLLGLVGITSGYVVDNSLKAINVSMLGWDQQVWLQLKKLGVVYKFEVSLVSDNIVFRPVRGRVTVDKRDLISPEWAMDDTQLALSVQSYYYQNTVKANSLIYPGGGWTPDVTVYQVDAGETLQFNIPITASLTSLVQPQALDFVGQFDNSASAYSIMSANSGLPVPAAQWNALGGSITVAIGEDQQSIDVTIVGASDPTGQYAPYRIAATAGPSNNYSSLRILGSGTFFTKTLYTQPTAISKDLASEEAGAVIDNEFISTLGQLYDTLIWALKRFGGARQTLSVRTSGINRAGDAGSYAYPTIGQFDAQMVAAGISTIAQFNTLYAGQSIQQFNDAEFATVSNAFVNQAFGNVAGARTMRDYLWWRIRQAQIGPDAVSYTAEDDTTLGDFDSVWTGLTVGDFNSAWNGYSVGDFNVAPLDNSGLTRRVFVGSGLYPSSQTFSD
jgi:hypothetical protein